ncbi:MAG: hypothetical protein LH477_18605 [Nocardioides sp.]|nr:hypothetical protein [Nocardioides sp.]
MSDLATTPVDSPASPAPSTGTTNATEPGPLDVRAPAIVRTVEQLMLQVESVVRRGSRTGLGSRYPKASISLTGSWARAESRWPWPGRAGSRRSPSRSTAWSSIRSSH